MGEQCPSPCLRALLNLLYPEVFTTTHAFDEAFNIGQGKLESSLLRHAHQLLQLLMLRRLKETVATALPSKLETLVSCPLAEAQLFWYRVCRRGGPARLCPTHPLRHRRLTAAPASVHTHTRAVLPDVAAAAAQGLVRSLVSRERRGRERHQRRGRHQVQEPDELADAAA